MRSSVNETPPDVSASELHVDADIANGWSDTNDLGAAACSTQSQTGEKKTTRYGEDRKPLFISRFLLFTYTCSTIIIIEVLNPFYAFPEASDFTIRSTLLDALTFLSSVIITKFTFAFRLTVLGNGQ